MNSTHTSTSNDEIRPFRIDVSDDALRDLHSRLDNTRWPQALPGAGSDRGIAVAAAQELAVYWHHGFDWRAQEAKLNEFPQFTTEIDGQSIHFVHVRSEEPDALPLLITHGYPSSIAEFQHLIGPLVDPAGHGAKGEQAFHVVAPSLPGYGFSMPVRETGWAMSRTGRAWAELMRRLGYGRYGLHGGDIGAGVSGAVAGIDAERVVGLHTVTDPDTAAATATFIPGMADGLDANDPVDKLLLERMNRFRNEDSGYLAIQNTRPQTVSYGLTDSPVAQLTWIAESFENWTDLPIDRDQLLTNVSIYWFTGAAASAAGFLYEQAHSHDWGAPPSVPQGFAVFGADETVRRVLNPSESAHWTEFAHGQHFPAMEAPTDLVRDLREFFGGLR
jgi:pimeloyl-ACP methyl ester carboxylesterase